jgi:hypothetical protein
MAEHSDDTTASDESSTPAPLIDPMLLHNIDLLARRVLTLEHAAVAGGLLVRGEGGYLQRPPRQPLSGNQDQRSLWLEELRQQMLATDDLDTKVKLVARALERETGANITVTAPLVADRHGGPRIAYALTVEIAGQP